MENSERQNERHAKVLKLFSEIKRTIDDGGPDSLLMAIGAFTGYSQLFYDFVGPRWRSSGPDRTLHDTLRSAHNSAVERLVLAAEGVGLNGGLFIEFGRLCREWCKDDRFAEAFRSAEFDTWPECLGTARENMPDPERIALAAGQAELHRLNARLGLADGEAAEVVAELDPSVALSDSIPVAEADLPDTVQAAAKFIRENPGEKSSNVAKAAGYDDPSSFRRAFKKYLRPLGFRQVNGYRPPTI